MPRSGRCSSSLDGSICSLAQLAIAPTDVIPAQADCGGRMPERTFAERMAGSASRDAASQSNLTLRPSEKIKLDARFRGHDVVLFSCRRKHENARQLSDSLTAQRADTHQIAFSDQQRRNDS